MNQAFIDLDELIVRCRDKSSRKFIQEAVSCYRAGAFRSCVVATWNAVVFDFLHKLRELELLGDKEAIQLLENFEKLRSSGNQFKELWQFESDIPDIALKKFELISAIEKSDIERLFEDRSRCAHPSMASLEEPFEATAELARYHLRSAVKHLLERPPVQGRAARKRIFQDIKSEYFPVDPELALQHFKKSPLARARRVLIKDVIIGTTKDLLIEERQEDERSRQFSALNAITAMYPTETREILNSQLSNIILSRVTDDAWERVIAYLSTVSAWDSLSEPCILKAKTYIDKIDVFKKPQSYFKRISEESIALLAEASHISFLRENVSNKLQIPLQSLLSLKESCTDVFFKKTILLPMLKELSPSANLKELLSMRLEESLASDETVQAHIKQKVQNALAKDLVAAIDTHREDVWLVQIASTDLETKIPELDIEDLLGLKYKYQSIEEANSSILELFNESITSKVQQEVNYISLEEISLLISEYEDEFFIDLINSDFEDKIVTAGLEDLLYAKSTYKLIAKPRVEVLEMLDKSILSQIEETEFDDLLDLRKYWSEVDSELIEPMLKNNIPIVIDRFAKSGSFDSAGRNAELLNEVAEHLSLEQWESILEAFFQNDQIYYSFRCYERFESLFEKSVEVSGSVQPYWISFREKLAPFKSKHSNSLKRLIDNRQ